MCQKHIKYKNIFSSAPFICCFEVMLMHQHTADTAPLPACASHSKYFDVKEAEGFWCETGTGRQWGWANLTKDLLCRRFPKLKDIFGAFCQVVALKHVTNKILFHVFTKLDKGEWIRKRGLMLHLTKQTFSNWSLRPCWGATYVVKQVSCFFLKMEQREIGIKGGERLNQCTP